MVELRRTRDFDNWFKKLRDIAGRANIASRISRLEEGHAGDHRSVGDGVLELRIHFGPGYRIYYTWRGETLVLLLCGGDKATQKRDIARAKALAEAYVEE